MRTVHLLPLGNGEMLLRVLLAVVLGSLLGLEREIDAQPAGFRTHILLCLGAALFGLISVHAFSPFEASRNATDVQIDVTRVASQVVVGVGFLGGGAILKYGASVRGLTTAASMWVTAAIGLAVGVGYYWPAVTVTGASIVALVVFRRLRDAIRRRFGRQIEVVTFRLARERAPGELLAALHDLPGVATRNVSVDRSSDQVEVTAELKTEPGIRLAPVLGRLADRAEVEELSLDER